MQPQWFEQSDTTYHTRCSVTEFLKEMFGKLIFLRVGWMFRLFVEVSEVLVYIDKPKTIDY